MESGAASAGGAAVKAGTCSPLIKIVVAVVAVVVTGTAIGVGVGLTFGSSGTVETSGLVVTTDVTSSASGQTTVGNTGSGGQTTTAAGGNAGTTSGTNDKTTGSDNTGTGQTTQSSSGNGGTTQSSGNMGTGQTSGNGGTTQSSGNSGTGKTTQASSGNGGTTQSSGNMETGQTTFGNGGTTQSPGNAGTGKTTQGSSANGGTTESGTSGDGQTTSRDPTTAATTSTEPTTAATTSTEATTAATTSTEATTQKLVECDAGYERTVIMMYHASADTDDLFFRGGGVGAVSIPLSYPASQPLGTSASFDKYHYWAGGDTVLDWNGGEAGQRFYLGDRSDAAQGSPAARTTNDVTDDSYYYLNTFGPNMWVMDTCMNCTGVTDNGWFDVKSYTDTGAWENDVNQDSPCAGNADLADRSKPARNTNHNGRCGKLNIFERGSTSCTINNV